jgi:hypothetical protein
VNHIMNTTYQKLNKKLDNLTTQQNYNTRHDDTNKWQHTTHHTKTYNKPSSERVINLSNITFSHEHINTLTLGPNYAITKNPKYFINNLIVDTENAIRQLEPELQNTYRHMAAKKIKQIGETGLHFVVHQSESVTTWY